MSSHTDAGSPLGSATPTPSGVERLDSLGREQQADARERALWLDLPTLLGELSRALRQIEPAGTALLTLPAPRVSPQNLLAALPTGDRFAWHTPAGDVAVGLGEALSLRAQGPGRFSEMQQAAKAIWPELRSQGLFGASAAAARLFGGFAFDVGGAASAPWTEFGDARFVLPRWHYEYTAARSATLTLAVGAEEVTGESRLSQVLGEFRQIRSGLLRTERPTDQRPPAPVRVSAADRPEWTQRVERLLEAIVSGRLEKVVLARRSLLEFSEPIDSVAALGRLQRHEADSTRFLFSVRGANFLGSTPECLIKKHGLHFETEALAGTVAAGSEARALQLLANPKELSEHAPVVRAISAALRPFAARIEYSTEPRLRRLRHVLHLQTPILGTLNAAHHVLELLGELHPTPAVGGVPRAAALEWIGKSEPYGRGWYAGPVGWFDANGDGEFSVALRSGLVVDRQAYVFAGSGIVFGSEASTEFTETQLKQATLLSALGG